MRRLLSLARSATFPVHELSPPVVAGPRPLTAGLRDLPQTSTATPVVRPEPPGAPDTFAPDGSATNAVERLRTDIAHTVFIRRLTLAGYLLAIPPLRVVGVPLSDAVLVALLVWIASTVPFWAAVRRQRDDTGLLRAQVAYYAFELVMMLFVVHQVGGADWVGVFFPTFSLYYFCTLLPRRAAYTFTVLMAVGFCSMAVAEALGILAHHPLFVRAANDFRDPAYLIGTLTLTAIGGYGLLALTFERFGRLQRETAAGERQRRAQAEALFLASEALGANQEPEALMRAIARAALIAMGTERAAVWLADPDAGVARRTATVAQDGLSAGAGPDALPLDHPLAERILREGGVVVANDRASGPAADAARLFGARSILIVPMLRNGRAVGALTAASVQRARAWTASEVSTLSALAIHGALALERAEATSVAAEAAALRRLDQLKSDFFHAVGHELRRPLTIAMGYLELLSAHPEHVGSDRSQAFLLEALASTRDMAAQLDDLADLARAEAGVLRLERVPVDLTPVLRGLAEAYRGLEGGSRIRAELPASLPLVEADAVRVRQVVGNLLANALRYAPEGPIVLTARASSDGIDLAVTDQGPGIPAAERTRIWERYVRGSGAHQAAPGGSGIGLAVVRTLVEAHGGTVALTCPDSGGTIVHARFPASSAAGSLPMM